MAQGDNVGRRFRVLEGPFQDFTGELIESDEDDGTVVVLVDVFGRQTPIRLPRQDLGDEGGDSSGDREPRDRPPSSGEMAAAVEPDL
jgi:hypothetical protein